ncbi:flagellar basal body protein, partial [Salmonella enterica subsp. enterica]|nr:flagellar basal body protein [Salmonella enterica]
MLDKLTDAMQFSAEALKLRARRQEVLTSNISNVDTPNYKAVDFDFQSA